MTFKDWIRTSKHIFISGESLCVLCNTKIHLALDTNDYLQRKSFWYRDMFHFLSNAFVCEERPYVAYVDCMRLRNVALDSYRINKNHVIVRLF